MPLQSSTRSSIYRIFREILYVQGNKCLEVTDPSMEYTEPDGTKLLVWAKGNVEGVPVERKKRKRKRSGSVLDTDTDKELERNQVIIKWDERYLTPGEENFQTMRLLKSKYNKRGEKAWRCLLDGD